jgi:hypothetical protein
MTMLKRTDGQIALTALIAFAVWVLIILPIIYAPSGFELREWLTHDAAGFFTSALVVVGVVQLALFFWQLRLIRASLDDAKISADAAAHAAASASRQAHVEEETLAKIERPYIFVFNVSALNVVDEIERHKERYTWIGVTYSVANHGKIPAIIKFAQAGLSVFTEPTSPPRLEYNHELVTSPILAAGEVRVGIEERLEWHTEYPMASPTFGQNELWFWVIIAYRGPFSDQHETRMCWRYDEATGRFTGPFGGPEYSGEK